MRITCQFWQRVGLSVLSDATMNTTTMNHWHQGKQHCVFSVCGVILRPFYTSRCKIKNPEDDVAGIGMDYCTSCQVITITIIPIGMRCSESPINCFYKKIWNLTSWFTSRESPHWTMLLRDPAVLMRPLHPGMRDQAVRKVVGYYAISLKTNLLQEILL